MTDKPLRADAQRNRDRIVSIATEAFADQGAEASLEDIAHRSAVGIGTLYRHFPNREALYIAVHRGEIGRIAERGDELLTEHPGPEALRLWVDEFLGFLQAKQGGMASVFRAVMADGENPFIDLRVLTQGAAERLLAAAAQQGGSAEVDPSDVLVALHGISLATEDPDQTARLVDLLMAGLCTQALVPAPTVADAGRVRGRPHGSTIEADRESAEEIADPR
jgi:AcrR family transcriptional regulator